MTANAPATLRLRVNKPDLNENLGDITRFELHLRAERAQKLNQSTSRLSPRFPLKVAGKALSVSASLFSACVAPSHQRRAQKAIFLRRASNAKYISTDLSERRNNLEY